MEETEIIGLEQGKDYVNVSEKHKFHESIKLHPLSQIEKGIEFLDLEENDESTPKRPLGLVPSKGWTDNLCYGTGSIYLIGLSLGGMFGFREGVKNCIPEASGKIKINTILNHITKRGSYLGNTSGTLGMIYNLIDSVIDSINSSNTDFNSILSGALTGCIYKCSAGLKPMLYSSVLMTTFSGLWCGFKKLVI